MASKNGVSRSAPSQNVGNGVTCIRCTSTPVLQFSSASELISYRKKQTVSQYYTNPTNMFPIKNRYASMYTVFKDARSTQIPTIAALCCNNRQLTAISDGKTAPFFLNVHNRSPD